jgi:PAS domain S-box-containing protein
VSGLAQNTTIEIYLTELSLANGDRNGVTEEAAQSEFMRILLVATADRGGFTGQALGPNVPANVQRQGVAGLAVLDGDGRTIVSTADFPAIDARLRGLIDRTRRDAARGLEDIYAGPGGQPTMAFAAPVTAVQGDPGSRPVGFILGVRDVRALYPVLSRPPTTERSGETILVRRTGDELEYVSPLADGSAPLTKRLAAGTPGLVDANLVAARSGFLLGRDYRGDEVLALARPITGAPWVLIHKVDRSEALADSDDRLTRLLYALVLIVIAVSIALFAVWRHGASVRAASAAAQFHDVAGRFEQQGRLLRLVTDSQPAEIFIADPTGRVRFANRVVAERTGVASDDLAGKPLANVFGPAEAKRYEDQNKVTLAEDKPRAVTQRLERNGQPRVVVTEHIPLAGEAGPTGVLVVESDITQAVHERERRERTLSQVVRTLVAAVDRRDPFAAQHSARVAQLARSIAGEMGLEDKLAETAEIAGNLMNIGKLLVPAELLTRAGTLSDDERRQIRDSLYNGADLLAGIEFEGPVVDTLHQALERWDGSGPKGLAGEAILPTARIVAVANAFVAMISSRAHRAGKSVDEALAALQAGAGTAYDRRMVTALANYLENRGGRQWATEAAKPADAT